MKLCFIKSNCWVGSFTAKKERKRKEIRNCLICVWFWCKWKTLCVRRFGWRLILFFLLFRTFLLLSFHFFRSFSPLIMTRHDDQCIAFGGKKSDESIFFFYLFDQFRNESNIGMPWLRKVFISSVVIGVCVFFCIINIKKFFLFFSTNKTNIQMKTKNDKFFILFSFFFLLFYST